MKRNTPKSRKSHAIRQRSQERRRTRLNPPRRKNPGFALRQALLLAALLSACPDD